MSKVAIKKHLKELQWRLSIVALFFIAGATLAYTYQEQLIPALMAPLHGQKLIYLNPAGGFSFIFLISIYTGLAIALPILVQQLYAFLRPALPEKARKKSSAIIISSFLLLGAGVAFGYFVAVPNALNFLMTFADQYVSSALTADSYLNFVIAYTIGIGLVFQIPLLLLLIDSIKPLKPTGLLKSERWIILGAFIVAAIITPTPDPINQAIVAGPVIIVYQLGVVAILLKIARIRRVEKKQAKASKKAMRTSRSAAEVPAPIPTPSVPTPAIQPAMQRHVPAVHTVPQPRDISRPHSAPSGGLLASLMTNAPAPSPQPRPMRSATPLTVTPRTVQQPISIPARQPQGRSMDGIVPARRVAGF
jgi:sec-independent protein translocase protein TatC